MNDATGPQGPQEPGGEPIGSVGEEAAKLFAALSGWAKGHGSEYAGAASGAATAMSAALKDHGHDIGDHIATGGEDCRYCPVCQVIHAVRQTSPEVKAHLAIAASSLMQAAAGILATQVPREPAEPVQRIDLDGDGGWDGEA